MLPDTLHALSILIKRQKNEYTAEMSVDISLVRAYT